MSISSVGSPSLREAFDRWQTHASNYYRRRDGSQSREAANFRSVVSSFARFAGEASPADRINRHQVRAWMDQLAAEQNSRGYVNVCLRRLRQVVRWLADLDIIPASIHADLSLLRALQPHRSPAIELPPVPPVDDARLAAVLRHLPAWARDACVLLRSTAARPGEILAARACEIRLEPVPVLLPTQHKTAHRGRPRVIPLNSAALAIVERRWRPIVPASLLFESPKTGQAFGVCSLGTAIDRAAKAAGVKTFNPNQIRHAAAKKARRACGLDAAQLLLGHAKAETTEIYTRDDDSLIIDPLLRTVAGVLS